MCCRASYGPKHTGGAPVPQRIDKSWVVIDSIEPFPPGRCVDVFMRPNGSYGFEDFRRHPEDAGLWTPVQYFSAATYASKEAALSAATAAVPWLKEALAGRSGGA
jgi:hypothetical protein